jgi:hypothetical protein
MPDTPNFMPAFVVLGSTGVVAVLATPILWRALRQKTRAMRVLLTSLGCIGLAGLVGAAFEASNPSRYEMAAVFALISSLLLQLLILPLLVFLSRKI